MQVAAESEQRGEPAPGLVFVVVTRRVGRLDDVVPAPRLVDLRVRGLRAVALFLHSRYRARTARPVSSQGKRARPVSPRACALSWARKKLADCEQASASKT